MAPIGLPQGSHRFPIGLPMWLSFISLESGSHRAAIWLSFIRLPKGSHRAPIGLSDGPCRARMGLPSAPIGPQKVLIGLSFVGLA